MIGAHSTANGNNRSESQVHKRWVQPRKVLDRVAALVSFAAPGVPVVRCEVLGYLVTQCYMYVMTCASKSIYEVMTLQDVMWHAAQLILRRWPDQ